MILCTVTHIILLTLHYSSGEKYPRAKGNFVLRVQDYEVWKLLRRDRRHRISLVLICIRLCRLHIGKDSNYVYILLTVFQSR